MRSQLRDAAVDSEPTRSPAPLVASVAVVTALVGIFFTAQIVAGFTPLVALDTEARSGSLSLWVTDTEMLSHEHSDHSHDDEDGGGDGAAQGNEVAEEPTFAMSASLSPGTPEEGFQRLQIELDLMNREAGEVTVGPPDFYLVADDGTTWAPIRGGTFGMTIIGPLQVLSTVLAFDVSAEVSASEVELVWTVDGKDTHFAVGEDEGHSHG